MAKDNWLVDIDLHNNQLLNATLQNLAVAPATTNLQAGFIYWNTAQNTAYCYTGLASPNEWLDLGSDGYTPPVVGPFNPTLSGANVLNALVVNNYGNVISATTRTMTAADIGAANLVHTHTLSQITDVTASAAEVNLLDLGGLVAGWVLKATGPTTATWSALLGSELTNDLSWVSIADNLTNTTNTWSSQKIQDLIDTLEQEITGALVNKGGYNASTNTPALDASPIAGIKNGWTYVVTVAGTFFTDEVQPGDMIIANKDNPTVLGDWTVVNKNIPDIVPASQTEQGIVYLASDAEVQAGSNTTKAITPSGLSSRTATETRTGILSLATQAEVNAGIVTNKAVTPATLAAYFSAAVGGYAASFGDGSATSFNITHGLNTLDVTAQVVDTSNGETVHMQVRRTSTTVVNVQCNVPPTTNQYRVVIKK